MLTLFSNYLSAATRFERNLKAERRPRKAWEAEKLEAERRRTAMMRNIGMW